MQIETKRRAVLRGTSGLLSIILWKITKSRCPGKNIRIEKSHRNISVEFYPCLKQFRTQGLLKRFCIKQILTYLSTMNMHISAWTHISFWHPKYPAVSHFIIPIYHLLLFLLEKKHRSFCRQSASWTCIIVVV